MAIVPCEKLLICFLHWQVHVCSTKTAICTGTHTLSHTHTHTHTRTRTLICTQSIFVKSHFYRSHRVTLAQSAVKYQCHS